MQQHGPILEAAPLPPHRFVFVDRRLMSVVLAQARQLEGGLRERSILIHRNLAYLHGGSLCLGPSSGSLCLGPSSVSLCFGPSSGSLCLGPSSGKLPSVTDLWPMHMLHIMLSNQHTDPGHAAACPALWPPRTPMAAPVCCVLLAHAEQAGRGVVSAASGSETQGGAGEGAQVLRSICLRPLACLVMSAASAAQLEGWLRPWSRH